MSEQLIEIKTGIGFAESENKHIKIDNTLPIKKIVIIHNAGAFGGGATGVLIANTILDNLRVFVHGKETISLIGDVDVDSVPYAIQLMREANKLRNRVADADEYFEIDFPKAIGRGHNIYIDFRFNTIANMNDGDRTTYTGATIDVMVETGIPGRKSLLRNCGKIVLSTHTGRLPEFINPTEFGYKALNLMAIIEDNGVPSNTAITKLELRKGSNIIREGSIPKLQELTKGKFGIALGTGFVWIPIRQAVSASQLKLICQIDTAGTNIEAHWMLTSLK
ncbi:TPA_asm: DJR-fold major capsid protein [Lokiarchaeia virus SkuldV3]|uniref:DJR-fold major capsid protein n=1 Tax=Lokiarchaeia virus SkuldV3 TaxID=2983915 RepID=A0A9N6YJQ7_9VIRU|nr:DJR-fold major capsid protein [Lokiarchaeia virus SkuldV3]DAZ90952.1 TPA_asm: DJR-fold major capsid protein [Lokiarchaeia virus SkuldV3]